MIAARGEWERARVENLLDRPGQSAGPGSDGLEAPRGDRSLRDDVADVGHLMAEVGQHPDQPGSPEGGRPHQRAGLARPNLDRCTDQRDPARRVQGGFPCHPVSMCR